MAMSFYGGRPGFSFIIVKSFTSEEEMIANFQLGPDYTEVHYEEHVLINTDDKNDPDNGKIYRRGYDYTNDLGGAIYIGSIVGPAGPAPMLDMTTIEDVKAKKENLTEEEEFRYGEGSYSPIANLVPGKDEDGNFNDSIQYAWISIRDENGSDTVAYIAFLFPYLVEEFEATTISGYEEASVERSSDDDGSHPYYSKWQLNIPKGIKGDAFKNLQVISAADNDEVQSYDGQDDDRANGRQILVYEYYCYDRDESGEPIKVYLGDYNKIENITLDEEGLLTIDYAHDDDDTYNLAWVKGITVSETGQIILHYTGGKSDETLSEKVRWIEKIEMSSNGTITVTYNDGTLEVFDSKVKWITGVSLTSSGKFTVSFNDGTSTTSDLVWVSDVTLNSTGTIVIQYNDGNSTRYENYLKSIKTISLDSTDHKFHVTYNTGTEDVINDIIKFIDEVYVKDSGDGADYLVHVKYNTGDDEVISTQPANYIDSIAIDDGYHLLIYYTNANVRQAFIDGGSAVTWNGLDGWVDLGSIKDDSGILIGFNLTPTECGASEGNDQTTIITYLNTTYPDGLTNSKYKGKVVTIGTEDGLKYFYAYDYDDNTWYYLGTFENSDSWTMVAADDGSTTLTALQNNLAVGGVWFITEEG